MGEREGRSLPAGEFEPLGVQAHRGVVLVQGQEHRHRDHVPLKALVAEQEAAGESALHELSRPVGRLAGTRELRGNQHHQEAAAETVLGRPVGNPREPLAGHRVQARVEPSPHDQLRLEPLSQRRFAGIDALNCSLQCVCGFEQVDFLCEVRIGERERDLRRGGAGTMKLSRRQAFHVLLAPMSGRLHRNSTSLAIPACNSSQCRRAIAAPR